MTVAFVALTIVSLTGFVVLGFLLREAHAEARDERRQLLNRLAVAQAAPAGENPSYIVPEALGQWRPGTTPPDPEESDPDAEELALVGTVQAAMGEETD